MVTKKKTVSTSRVVKTGVVVIGLIAGAITILAALSPPQRERHIQLIFVDKNKMPCRHARVRVTGLDLDLSTTSDGDTTITIKKGVKVITGVIYYPTPLEFRVVVNETTDHYLVRVVY